MISFIVIGKDEGWKLSLCFDSIIASIETNEVKCYEILYIDAQSSDNSLNVAKAYSDIKSFSLTGKCSAAIARNAGGKEAKGDILFFLDGDMELQADFVPMLFNTNKELIHPFLSGINYHWFYNSDWKLINKKLAPSIQSDVFEKATGGFFVITRKLWLAIGGMDARLQANEDLDLGLRLSKKGIFPLRIAKVGIIHHTIENMESSRIWRKLLLYRFPAVLARKHLFTNRYYTPLFLRMNYGAVLLLMSLIALLFSPIAATIYLFVIIARSLKRGLIRNFKILPYFIGRDLLFLGSFFCFFPSFPKMEYKRNYFKILNMKTNEN